MNKVVAMIIIILLAITAGCETQEEQEIVLESNDNDNLITDKERNLQQNTNSSNNSENNEEEISGAVKSENKYEQLDTEMDSKELQYLLSVEITTGVMEDLAERYLINVQNIISDEDYDIDFDSRISKEVSEKFKGDMINNFRKFSINGKYALYVTQLEYGKDLIEIYNLQNGNIVFEELVVNSAPYFSSDLNYCILKEFNYSNSNLELSYYLRNISDTVEVQLEIDKTKDVINMMFSPDNTKIAYQFEEEGKWYIEIYDLKTRKVESKVCIGEGYLYLTQWHESNKILYSYTENFKDTNGYIFHVDKSEIKLLGKYFLNPILSPDGRYLAYYMDSMWMGMAEMYDSVEYRKKYKDYGLFLMDMQTGTTIKLPPRFWCTEDYAGLPSRQSPLQWFYVEDEFEPKRNRLIDKYELEFNKQNEELQYKTYTYIENSSKLDGNYNTFNIVDSDKATAWVENEESYNKNGDGKGIGEWIKIKEIKAVPYTMLSYEIKRELSGLKIINGYAKSEEVYKANNRVKKVKIEFSDGSSITRELEDNNLDFQNIDFGKSIKTKYVKITILDIYKGDKYNDTAISEIELY